MCFLALKTISLREATKKVPTLVARPLKPYLPPLSSLIYIFINIITQITYNIK